MARNGMSRRWVMLVAAGSLAGCSGGRPLGGIWPFGGGGRPPRTAAAAAVSVEPVNSVADGTVLVPAVRFAVADRGRQGVILRAEGIAPTQGFHTPELRPVGRDAAGIETVELRAWPPEADEAVGPERTRLLTVARFYPIRAMGEIRGFRVVGGQNSVTVGAP